MRALADAGVAYVEFTERNVGSFRVMFQQQPDVGTRPVLAEAARTYAVLEGLAEAVVDAGLGRGLTGPVVAQVCWAAVHGVATLTTEGLLADNPRAESAGHAVVSALADLLR